MAYSISNTFLGPRAPGLSPAITDHFGDQASLEDSGQVESGDTAVLETPSEFLLGASTHTALTTAKGDLLGRFYKLAHQLVEGGPALQNVLLAESVAVAALTGATVALGMLPIVLGGVTGDRGDDESKSPTITQLVGDAGAHLVRTAEKAVGDAAVDVSRIVVKAVDGAPDVGNIILSTTLPAAVMPGVIALGETGADIARGAERVIGDVASDGMKFAGEGGKAYFDITTSVLGPMYCPIGPVFLFADLLAGAIEYFYDPKLPRGNRSAFARLCSRLLERMRG